MSASSLILLLVAQGVEITPGTASDVDNVLRGLGERHRVEPWCSSECATVLLATFAGELARGELRFAITGTVTGEQRRLCRAVRHPAQRRDRRGDGAGRRARALFWSGSAYGVVLEPGDFNLTGTLRFAPMTPVTLRIPGPAGSVELRVPDADVVGTGERRGWRDATYQLTPKQTALVEGERERLRLQVDREFFLARDRTFSVSMHARGTKPVR